MESGQPFDEFVLQCARAFGALIMMRDDAMDTPIPEAFEASNYNKTRLEDAKKELARLQAMTPEMRLDFGKARKADAIASSEKNLAQQAEQNARLDAMAEKVKAWQPPTSDHAELKNFMLDQIRISRDSGDYWLELLTKDKAADPMEVYNAALKAAQEAIPYHTKEHQKEVERMNARTEWVRQLRKSLT